MNATTTTTLLLLALSINACTSYADRRANRLVQVCAAGLSAQTAAKVSALTKESQEGLSIEVTNEIKGAIFSDPGISSSDRVHVYERYLECIKNDGIENKNEDAKSTIQRVQHTNDYRAAGFFSSYNWISKYSRGYKNIGDRTVECRLRVRGVLKNKSDDSISRVGEIDDYTFKLYPGNVDHIDGEVGVYGFSNSRYVVTTDDRLECWYR